VSTVISSRSSAGAGRPPPAAERAPYWTSFSAPCSSKSERACARSSCLEDSDHRVGCSRSIPATTSTVTVTVTVTDGHGRTRPGPDRAGRAHWDSESGEPSRPPGPAVPPGPVDPLAMHPIPSKYAGAAAPAFRSSARAPGARGPPARTRHESPRPAAPGSESIRRRDSGRPPCHGHGL
jgi:hypothetical protein